MYLNVCNPYHVNIWTPRQWESVLAQYFEEVEVYAHGVKEIWQDFLPEHFSKGHIVSESDFVFQRTSIESLYANFTLTAIFIATKPIPHHSVPKNIFWIDDSFSRSLGQIDPNIRNRLQQYFEAESVPLTVNEPVVYQRPNPHLKQSIPDRIKKFLKNN